MNRGICDPQFRLLLHADLTQPEIEGLRAEWQHSITLVQEADGVPRIENGVHQNCYTFALGHDRWIGPALMNDLLKTMQPKAGTAAISGDLVVYFRDDDSVAHSGLVQGELVRSKWAGGAVWDHGVFEIPASYGSTIKFFEPIARNDVGRAYRDWANTSDDVRYPGRKFPANRAVNQT